MKTVAAWVGVAALTLSMSAAMAAETKAMASNRAAMPVLAQLGTSAQPQVIRVQLESRATAKPREGRVLLAESVGPKAPDGRVPVVSVYQIED